MIRCSAAAAHPSSTAPVRASAAALAIALAACAVDPGSDREGIVVSGIAVDSVRFLPLGSRFVIRGEPVPVAFLGYHAGYTCSEFLELGLEESPAGDPPAYRPRTRVRLPGGDDCPLDGGNRDTVALHAFDADSLIRLAGAAGLATDAAMPVRGRLEADSLRGVPDSAGRSIAAGDLTFTVAGSGPGGTLAADSVPACRYLNSAEAEAAGGDTLLVRITWVILDPASSPDTCRGGPHPDAAPAPAARPLRMGGR